MKPYVFVYMGGTQPSSPARTDVSNVQRMRARVRLVDFSDGSPQIVDRLLSAPRVRGIHQLVVVPVRHLHTVQQDAAVGASYGHGSEQFGMLGHRGFELLRRPIVQRVGSGLPAGLRRKRLVDVVFEGFPRSPIRLVRGGCRILRGVGLRAVCRGGRGARWR